MTTTTQNTQIAKQDLSQSERFSNMVIKEFTGNNGAIALTQFQKRLVQNYFISTDMALKKAEEKRLAKDERYRDSVPVTWQNVNMEALAVNVVSCARIGYDPALPNHINMVPYKNNSTQKYDIGFVPGYRGKELMATKYGLNIPTDVVIELVYSTDVFKVIKKDLNNSVESYQFEVVSPFDRGEIIGGFYYHVFEDKTKNKLVFYSKHEIDKRRPGYASSEFWGGTKDKWEKDPSTGKSKKVGTEVVEGWYAEMAWKTLCRAAYGAITIDSQKIDDDFIRLSEIESRVDSLNTNDKDVDSRNDAVNKKPETVKTEDVDFVDVTKQPNEPAKLPEQVKTDPKPEAQPAATVTGAMEFPE